MAYVNSIFNTNFIEYASYVIKDRAIPHLDDGLKPVQRRILQSLFDVDDGKFNKVANVVGHCMQYHPHGDASIYGALVNLANKDLFIDKQGNFGNIFTGDPASAARYIECRLLPLAKTILYNPEITDFEETYDGRRKEPIVFPSKIPLILVLGAEGIAVGMSTKILPHNLVEVLKAERSFLMGEGYELYPDFPTGGLVDVTDYREGNGKILSRAKLDTKDPKKITVTELPYGTTTETLITSIEAAARKNKIKIGRINDFTTDTVEIEITLPRGVHTKDVLDGLYAFTDCEVSLSLNLLVIGPDSKPKVMTIPEVIEYHAGQLIKILKKELILEQGQLLDRLHARTLERIFIEERIYKAIEQMKSPETISLAIRDGFLPYMKEITRDITEEDIERLLKIPIRRISLYDINKMKKEVDEILARLKEIKHHLKHLKEYAIATLDELIKKQAPLMPRKTEIMDIQKVDIRDAAQKNLKIRYNKETGYIGSDVSSGVIHCEASVYDRILIVRKDCSYQVMDVPDKFFIGKGMLYCGLTDKETLENTVFSIVYRNTENGYPYVKRCKVTQFILNKVYDLLPENSQFVRFTTKTDVSIVVDFIQKSLIRTGLDTFPLENYLVKGVKAQGVRIKPKEFSSARFIKTSTLEKKEN
ncbi:DNA topoisomerase IV subunit A [Oceanispirochaeta crateris]|jgi:topoisomerase-4 subunit A|uniref:DNA topoisomerase IV subunit A n=1 Tax=Oceanispirochaeta crateris TaxID=2518645 RepID=A0A5C1QLJ3_9SPIO|nr:DNA topoisomerase IV subunit A [Oceanispirochaeta crateris]QEN07840.1 DNA topoisomerase IV subunit A [Oceanispirochaeta crateris]